MNTRSAKLNVPLPALIAVVVLAVLALVWQVSRSVGEEPRVREAQSVQKFISDLALKTGGDASKLTPEERKKLDEITGDPEESVIVLRNQMQMGGAPTASP